MAKKSMIEREKKRIRLEKKYAIKRTVLLTNYQNEQDFAKKLELHSKIQKLPRNSAKTRIRNRCWKRKVADWPKSGSLDPARS